MTNERMIERREAARRHCALNGLAIMPYGLGAWIVGPGVSRVYAHLALVNPDELRPASVVDRL